MIRMTIKFDVISPFLRLISGTLYVEDIDSVNMNNPPKPTLLFKCKVKKEQYCVGYSSYEDGEYIPTKLFNCIKPLVDEKLRSYWHGMILENQDYAWVPLTGDDSWGQLQNIEQEAINLLKENRSGT